MKTSTQKLIEQGLLKKNEVLTLKRRGAPNQNARITSDGNIVTDDGKVHRSLSGAARHCLGRAVDGWTSWRLENGEYIDSLRQASKTQAK